MASPSESNAHNKKASTFPKWLRDFLAQEGVSEENYDRWVAGHEAAHAVIGIHHGAALNFISTSATTLGTLYSRADCNWNNLTGMTWNTILEIIAAGPAYDDAHAFTYGITANIRKQVDKDRITAEETVLVNIVGSSEAKELSWQQAIERATSLLNTQDIMRKVVALQPVIFRAIQDTLPLLTGDEVRVIIHQAK